MKLIDLLCAFFAAFIWGGTWVAGKLSLVYFTPITLLALRFLISAVAIFPFIKKGLYLPTRLVLLFTIANTLNHFGIFVALWLDIDISTSVVLTELSVPFSVIFGAIYFKENINFIQIFGISLAFFGTFYAIGGLPQDGSLVPIFLVLVSATSIACSNLLLKSYSHYDPLGLIAYSSLYMGIIFTISAYFLESSNLDFVRYTPISAIFPLLYLSILPIFAWIFWCNLIGKYPVSIISPFQLFVPIFAIICSYFILETHITKAFIIGLTILCLGHMITLYALKGDHNNV